MTDPIVNTIIHSQSDAVQELIHTLRPVIRLFAPDLEEYGQQKLGNIIYKGKKVVMSLSPYKSYVNLYFYYGTELQAPDGILLGSGKKLRHLRLNTPDDLDHDMLESLIKQSLELDGDH